jgi:hypothetical protein
MICRAGDTSLCQVKAQSGVQQWEGEARTIWERLFLDNDATRARPIPSHSGRHQLALNAALNLSRCTRSEADVPDPSIA